MSPIPKVPGVGHSEAGASYTKNVHIDSRDGAVSSVEPVRKIDRIGTDSGTVSPFMTEIIKVQIHTLKELYVEMNTHRHHRQGRSLDEEATTVIERMKSLLEVYNKTLNTVKVFDTQFHTNHAYNMYQVLQLFYLPLASIGLILNPTGHLALEEEVLYMALIDDSDCYAFLFDDYGVFTRILAILENIHIPKVLKKEVNPDIEPKPYLDEKI